MEIREGKKVFHGIAIGKVRVFAKTENQVSRRKIEDTQAEVARFEDAKQKAIDQLHALYEKALKEVGEVNAQIFDVHAMMLDDGDYIDSIHNLIEGQNVNAEYAVAQTGDNFAKMFADMDDEYFKARSVDVKDISERVITILNGNDTASDIGEDPVIIVAEDLAPSETVQMDKSKVLAFVTRKGSSNSHTAILARTMNIPALINIEYDESMDGKMAVVDGKSGKLIVDPDAETLKKYEDLRADELAQRTMLKELKGKETVTKSGRKLHLYANIGSTGDVAYGSTILIGQTCFHRIRYCSVDHGNICIHCSIVCCHSARSCDSTDHIYFLTYEVAGGHGGSSVVCLCIDIFDRQVLTLYNTFLCQPLNKSFTTVVQGTMYGVLHDTNGVIVLACGAATSGEGTHCHNCG